MMQGSTTRAPRNDKGIPRRAAEDRFWEKVDRSGGPNACWLWLGGTQRGYGIFWPTPERSEGAHRYAYKTLVGPIPEGMELDHVRARGCTNTHCVNPAHLEVVTPRINKLRGNGMSARYARATQCLYGHPYDEANTKIRKNGVRRCRECDRLAGQKRTEARRALRARLQALSATLTGSEL